MKQRLTIASLVLSFGLMIASNSVYALKETSLYVKPLNHLGSSVNNKNGTSSNWSGYAVESNLSSPLNNAVNQVLGQWVVPAVTCTRSTTYSSTWVGIDGYSDGTVEQTGTEQDCYRGKPVYYAWFETYPQPEYEITNLPVAAGNTMSASVQYTSPNLYTLTIKNMINGSSYSTTRRLAAQRQSAEWVQEAPSSWFGVLPLANFGTVNFTGSSANLAGQTGTISSTNWQNDEITMLLNINTPKAIPSALSPDGSSFSVTWKHS
jgi:hypothetical protein